MIDPSEADTAKDSLLDACLSGNQEEVVNLWQLRELSVSPGGCLSSLQRKRIWPKLTGAYVSILRNSASFTHPEVLEPSRQKVLSRDEALHVRESIQRGVWSFAEFDVEVNEPPPAADLSSAETSPRGADPLDDTKEQSTTPDNETDIGGSEHKEEDTKGSQQPTPQQLLANAMLFRVVTSILRMPTEYDDEHYRFYDGLQDLVALLMLNLESDSLAYLLVGKLARYHLLSALLGQRDTQDIFRALLSTLDSELYDKLEFLDHVAPSVEAWCWRWFASDVKNFPTASRLVDVFIASHPWMPIYFSVALLTHHRQNLLVIDDAESLRLALDQMPSTLVPNENDVGAVEKIIETSISYMRELPPSAIMPAAVPPVPVWATRATAPTDYAVLTMARSIREEPREPYPIEAEEMGHEAVPLNRFPLAMAAAGKGQELTDSQTTAGMRRLFWSLCCLILILCLVNAPDGTVPSALNHPIEAVKTSWQNGLNLVYHSRSDHDSKAGPTRNEARRRTKAARGTKIKTRKSPSAEKQTLKAESPVVQASPPSADYGAVVVRNTKPKILSRLVQWILKFGRRLRKQGILRKGAGNRS